MNSDYLIEIQKWLRIFHSNQSTGPMNVNEALFLRRLQPTNKFIPPELSLRYLVNLGIVRVISDGTTQVLHLSKLGASWIRDMQGDPDYQLLRSHKHAIAEHLLADSKYHAQVRAFVSVLVRDEHGRFRVREELITSVLPLVRWLVTLEVVDHRAPWYDLVPEFEYLVEAVSKVQRGTSEEQLLKQLESKRDVGLQGEKWVLKHERERITEMFPDCRFDVERVSESNVALGYDIYSRVYPFVEERYIEVKSTVGKEVHFFWTANEMKIAKKLSANYWLYVLTGFRNGSPQEVYYIQDPYRYLKERQIVIEPVLFELSLSSDEHLKAMRVQFPE